MTNAATAEQQKIVEGFQKLRQQQQEAAGEIGRVEADLRTHQTVLKTVETLDPDRKCFRQVGDTLVEYKASELVQIMTEIIAKFKERLKELSDQVVELGKEINSYKEKNNIRLLSQKDFMEFQKKSALEKIGQIEKPAK